MREIKFRAWADGRMRYVTNDCYWYMGDTGYWSLNIGDLPGKILCDSLESIKPILIQFTGIKDKNGVDIYEGDIVKMNLYFSDYPPLNLDFTGEVVILPSMGVCLKNPNVVDNLKEDVTWKHNGYNNVRGYRSEVIGNIYEDNHLLRQAKEGA